MLRSELLKLTPGERKKLGVYRKRIPAKGLRMLRSELLAIPREKRKKMSAAQKKRYDKHHKIYQAYRDKLLNRVAKRQKPQGVAERQGKVGIYFSHYQQVNGSPVYRGPAKGLYRKSFNKKRYIPQRMRNRIRYDRS